MLTKSYMMCFVLFLFLFCTDHLKYAVNLFRSGCNSEQVAAGILGYTQVSWDNESGKEQQPVSADKAWAALTQHERSAAMVLGYTRATWDNKSGSESQPASADKHWAELTACGD